MEYNGKESLFDDFIKFLGNELINCSFAHGDFHSRNLISTDQGIKIIDWEFFSPRAPLEVDYINLLLYEESFLSGRTYYEITEDFLTKRLQISDENRFKKYKNFVNSVSPQIALLYCLQHQDYALGRYEQIAFVPYSKCVKINQFINLLEDFLIANNKL